ncbi:glycosyltransferase family 2 protein [Thioalkalivibrio nitratireducens]|uniref:glycosyltransferase family 2 protein n=1 Tax=Thioalkalivibrio nitratireducens TaxID=186931 RepID=UPI001F4905FD|nr:glycosyltransferase family 2 protein [Thioalkalivibrio nitratireducens]
MDRSDARGPQRGLVPQVSVIVVSFNSGPLLAECVHAVWASTVAVEVLVSDNGSVDGSVDDLIATAEAGTALRVRRNGRNLGFAGAANAALPQARAPWLLFLNPDCLVRSDTLERMLEVVSKCPEVGIAGCLIRNPDGSEQAGCRRREPTPWRSLARVLHLNRWRPDDPRFRDFNMVAEPLPLEPVPVDAISGAFMLVRHTALAAVGPLDPGYFLHCEDLDWCRRFRDAGYTVLFVPGVDVLHHKGVSSRGRAVRVELHKHRGMLRYYRKFFRERYPRPLMWLVQSMVWARFGVLAVVLGLRRRRT